MPNPSTVRRPHASACRNRAVCKGNVDNIGDDAVFTGGGEVQPQLSFTRHAEGCRVDNYGGPFSAIDPLIPVGGADTAYWQIRGKLLRTLIGSIEDYNVIYAYLLKSIANGASRTAGPKNSNRFAGLIPARGLGF